MGHALSADRLFFLSALSFTVSFALYTIYSYLPFPAIGAEMPVEVYNPLNIYSLLNQGGWILSVAGVVIFLLGLVARKRT